MFGLSEVYPKSSTVLIWIGTASSAIVAAVWVLVQAHPHPQYMTTREINLILDKYNAVHEAKKDKTVRQLHAQLDKLTDTVIIQSKLIEQVRRDIQMRDKIRQNLVSAITDDNDSWYIDRLNR